MPTFVGHLDADAFYVSAERVRFRWLEGKPVAVLSNQGACVIARSYQMKAFGIKVGTPVWEAKKVCPEGVYLKRDFRWYEVLSRQLLEVVQRFNPKVEYYSIDEFFFAIRPEPGGSLDGFAKELRDRCLAEVGVPVTVGIGRSRTLAKLWSDSAKPFGARAATDPAKERELLAALPVTEISGIAGRRAERLAQHGIRTCLDLAKAPRLLVRAVLTRAGEALWYELNGDPVAPINTTRQPHKMLSRGGSLGGATADPNVIYAWLVRNLERLIEELEFHGVRAGRLTVTLSYKTTPGLAGSGPLDAPTDRFDELLDAGRAALRQAYRPGVPVVQMHVIASHLYRGGPVQRSLFEPPPEPAQSVARLKREVNQAVGRFALRSGATLPLRAVYDDHTNDYDICDVRGKTCF